MALSRLFSNRLSVAAGAAAIALFTASALASASGAPTSPPAGPTLFCPNYDCPFTSTMPNGIALLSYSFTPPGPQTSSGKVSFGHLEIKKRVDASSPTFFRLLGAGTIIGRLKIVVGAQELNFGRITVKSDEQGDTGPDGTPTEKIKFEFMALGDAIMSTPSPAPILQNVKVAPVLHAPVIAAPTKAP